MTSSASREAMGCFYLGHAVEDGEKLVSKSRSEQFGIRPLGDNRARVAQ